MHWYARQVTNNPSLVILLVLVIAATCVIIALTTNELPTFEDPLLGFEPRGTELAMKATAWNNLMKTFSWHGSLTVYPLKTHELINSNKTAQTAAWQGIVEVEKNKKYANDNHSNMVSEDSNSLWLELETEEHKSGYSLENQKTIGRLSSQQELNLEHRKSVPVGNSNFFCNDPGREYGHVVVQSISGENLFTVKGLQSICRIDEHKLRSSKHMTELCEKTSWETCCRSWSIANYVAVLQNLSSCHVISEDDVATVLDLLRSCAEYYHRMKLSHDCTADPALCRGVPKHCIAFDAVYNILHFLTDINFMSPQALKHNSSHLTYTSIFLPIARSSVALNYFKDLQKMTLLDNDAKIVAMNLGLKYALFDDSLIHDTFYVGLAGGLIFLLLWMYLSSFFVTFMTITAVAFSLCIAYFMYTVVYQVPFFPFMNLLTVVIIIGIGADDACIYCKIWMCAKADKNSGTLIKLVRDTLHHACLSMFITSVTTATAFFGSFISNITAIRCFSIFAGTAVLANFIFTVTWLPASVVIAEKWCSSTCCLCIPTLGVYLPQLQRFQWCSSICNSMWKLHYSFTDSARVFFEKILPCFIIKPRYLWLILFSALAIAGAVIVFYYPRLRLPDSIEFQIFNADHPFEMYDLTIKKYFRFERAKEKEIHNKLPIRMVWGILPVDNGNYLNPFDRGSLEFDPAFNVAEPESQKWLLSFCRQLRNQSFFQPTPGPLLSNCFIETFKSWMERRCVDGFSSTNRTPCCESSKFPYGEDVFNLCIKEAITILHRTHGWDGWALRGTAGPKFSRDTGKIKVVVVEYNSIFTYSSSYNDIYYFKTNVDNWVASMLKTAPEGMKNGWFISDLDFFDLQDSLSKGTLIAIGVAIAVSFASLLITTLNLLISIFAIITITCIIVVTVGSLVLLGWKLNVLESITVSVAIGLAVDFTLHYGVAYKLSAQEDRESSVIFALSRVGSPVAMAAFTSMMAGITMFSSVVLAYLQIGTFLALLMAISWIYSTFFLLSLLTTLGPQKGQLELNYPTVHCCETVASPVEKAPYALSESTLSTSSASNPNQIPLNESHELEPLTTVKGSRIEIPKYIKKKHLPRLNRPRSGSFSATLSRTKDPVFSVQLNRTPRKVSLPTVNIISRGDPSPRHLSGATSSSTIVCADDEKESTNPLQKEEMAELWTKSEISV